MQKNKKMKHKKKLEFVIIFKIVGIAVLGDPTN